VAILRGVPAQFVLFIHQVERHFMASTRTPGITVNATGERIINKEHYGVRLFLRLGPVSQEYDEARLRTEIAHLDIERERKDRSRPLFRDCAARYLAQSQHKRSIDVIK
jgi:hypothetical protein